MLAVRLLLRIAQANSMAPTIDDDQVDDTFDHHLHLKSDEEIRQIVRERVEHLYHPTSTCRMAPLSDKGVVDSKLKVHGIDKLRICDASIFSKIVSGHPVCAYYFLKTSLFSLVQVAACLAIAEKLADDLKADWHGKA
jgi:choline dehydrogenase